MLALIAFSAMAALSTNSALGQKSISEFHDVLRAKLAFNEGDFATLSQGRTVVRLLPVTDKREVAVFGLVGLQVPAQVFLQSFRDSIIQKSNPAILEIGKFGATPTASDLETLTFDDRDLDDLKDCVVGDCKLKLSAKMIERLRREVNWYAADYRIQATQLLKQILLDYVRDYLERGDPALIEYNDKPKVVRLADELRALLAESTYGDKFPEFGQQLNGSMKSEFSMVESAIVWSKIKFGLKPVIAINHIVIYKLAQNLGPQVFVASKQIYANHYFDSSLSLTAFVNIPGESASYLFYENRSRADGLSGLFGKMKRGLVEDRALNSLKNILESSKTNLNANALPKTELPPDDRASSWRGWKPRRVHVFLSLLLIIASFAFLTMGTYHWKNSFSGAPH